MRKNSPGESSDHVLEAISVHDATAFLMECANLPNPIWAISNAKEPHASPHFERWLRRWQRFFTFQKEDNKGKMQMRPIPLAKLERFAPTVRTSLHRIWLEKDARQRDWYFYRLRDECHQMIVRAENPDLLDLTDRNVVKRLNDLERTSESRRDDLNQREQFFQRMAGTHLFEEVPKICPFEAAVYWLQSNQKLMLYCEGPQCAAPYFIRNEKGQKYCSPECADPARRAAKLKWWNMSSNSPKNRVETVGD
jgi:hypothetical protein